MTSTSHKLSNEGYYLVFKTNFATLVEEIQPEPDLCDGLLSASVINEEEYLFAIDEKKKDKQRTRKILIKTLQSVRSKSEHFETFCDLLQKSELPVHQKWAKRLQGEASEQLNSKDTNGKENESLNVLKDQLSVLKKGILQSDENVEGKLDIVKEFLRTFILNSLEAGVDISELSRQLEALCFRDMVVHASLIDWTFDELKRLHDKSKTTPGDESCSQDIHYPLTPKNFFTKEHVCNCHLLCKTVASSDRSNFKSFLLGHSHEFDEVSFSHSTDEDNKLHPYIIAKVETRSELYIAFLGEPNLHLWQEKYQTFSNGISIQLSRIPIRFFIEQIRNGYTIYFTGFSMGGLLALSVYASLWKDTCLSMTNLLQSVVCITFATPLVPLEELEKTLKSYPDMKENSHLIIMEDDIVPRLLQFTEVKPTKKGGQFQSNAGGELIFNLLASYARQKALGKSLDDITSLKTILQEKKLAMSVDTKAFGKCHYIYTDSSRDHVSISLLSSGAVTERLKVPDVAELEQVTKLNKDILSQHTLSKYESNLIKAKFLQSSVKVGTSPQPKEVTVLKPEVSSITFYRHGDEIALVLQGNNLWFCSKLKITSKSGSRVIDTVGTEASSRSIHFNYVPKDDSDLLIEMNAETVDVVCYSHFASSIRRKVPAECKGEYYVTFRERQVARFTPDAVIVVSFLSALLEVKKDNRPSRRYKAIRKFLEESARIVPLESICHAIAFGPLEIAWKCAEAFTSTNVTIPPSYDLSVSLGMAHTRLMLTTPEAFQEVQRQAELHHQAILRQWTMGGTFGPPLPPSSPINTLPDENTSTPHQLDQNETNQAADHPSHSASEDFEKLLNPFAVQQPKNSKIILEKLQKLKLQVDKLCMEKANSGKSPRFICDQNIEKLFTEDSLSNKLLSPVSVLKKGYKELQDLQKETDEEIFQLLAEGEHTTKEFSNEKMISTLHKIVAGDLSICAFVLGAFMQQQIRVPFVDSPLDTVHILQTTESPPAVGVWALFCLGMIDFQKMAKGKKGKALVVKVEKYIKGIFGKGSEQWQEMFPDQLYAGKLQFVMQCLDSSVSCNSNYISYSFERQLSELCKECDIRPNTRVKELISNWDTIFNNNLLFYIMDEFRPIVSRWILWCLNIYHLRQELAAHITVGIIGLSNSGKSSLVKNLFKQKVAFGTTTMQRTTVPFLYNLEGLVDGLDVIDFPGVDDKDANVVIISNIMLQISQMVILVVEYKRCITQPVSRWVEILKNSGVPVLICLTHADKLFAVTCLNESGELTCSVEKGRKLIQQQLEKLCEKLEQPPNWTVDLFSFSQDSDSKLNTIEGIKLLADVGISFSHDVGLWIETELRHMQQTEIADKLKSFLSNESNFKQQKYSEIPCSPPAVRSLEVIAERSFQVGPEGYNFSWKSYGLKITFPPGAITKQNQCFVKVISSGQYQLPEGAELASSLYWLYFPERFQKFVDVEIQHCCPSTLSADSDNNALAFIKGQCDQELPYTFKNRTDGSFSSHDRKGLLSLKSFCILGVISWLYKQEPSITGPSPPMHKSMLCVVEVYAKCEGSRKCLFEFVFMKDLNSFHSDVEKRYQRNGWKFYTQETFEFDSVSLSVNISQDSLELNNWHCVKRNSGKIKQKSVNCCHPDTCPKHCLEFTSLTRDGPATSVSIPVKVFKGLATENELFEVTLSLPLVEIDTTTPQQSDFHDYDSSITSCRAVKVLRDSNFSFVSSTQLLMIELEIETEIKKKLQAQITSTGDYLMPLEEAIAWWISNKLHSWSLLVRAVEKIENNTAEKMKTIIPVLHTQL